MIWCVALNPALDVTYHLPEELGLDAVNLADAMDARLGGKGNNVARVVKALGASVTAVEILGGSVGEALVHNAVSHGMEILSEPILDDSRICLTLIGPHGSVTELRPPGPLVANETANRLLDALRGRVGPNDWVTISGSLPRGLGAETYGRWVKALKPQVAGVIVDASGAALLGAVPEGPTAIVPNRSEYEAVASALPPGVTEVVVTDGDKGVEWHRSSGGVQRWRAPRVQALNPVGAGDTFLGALVVHLQAQRPWPQAIREAMACASASVETLGVASFDWGRAQELLGQIEEEF